MVARGEAGLAVRRFAFARRLALMLFAVVFVLVVVLIQAATTMEAAGHAESEGYVYDGALPGERTGFRPPGAAGSCRPVHSRPRPEGGTMEPVTTGEELLEERRRRRRAGDPRITPEGRELLLRMTTGDLMDEFQAALDADLAADPILGGHDTDDDA